MKGSFFLIIATFFLITVSESQVPKKNIIANSFQLYDDDTRKLVTLVTAAAELIRIKGEAAFNDFHQSGSRWRQGETYIFVLDPEGNMLVHPDPDLEGKNQLNLKDINGKPIIRGLLEAATALQNSPVYCIKKKDQ